MRALIFILLKIGEVIGFLSIMIFISILITYIPLLYDFFKNSIVPIACCVIWLLSIILGWEMFKKDFKKWIAKNKEWSESIYNKIKNHG